MPAHILRLQNHSIVLASILIGVLLVSRTDVWADESDEAEASVERNFQQQVQPLLETYCVHCHNEEEMESGIRVDLLDGTMQERYLRLWEGIRSQLEDEAMPPEDEPQPSDEERKTLIEWIDHGLTVARSRQKEKNGSIRRLTVAQYTNTLRDLLLLDDNLTDVLPPDAVSKDGFVNNEQTMLLSPLLVEAYFDIAEKALDLCIVDENAKPAIQNFRMDLGKAINPDPFPEKLILGALSHLLENQDFIVSELTPVKPFDFEPKRMQTKFRFIEGYQGNDTVRGWREYDSIYHAVFACMRGSDGYPKGKPYETVPEGLLLRPAIPSTEIFGESSTYGPRANFKISLRELPDHGRFRVTVTAAKYDDGLMLDPDAPIAAARDNEATPDEISITNFAGPAEITIPQEGVYQADVFLRTATKDFVEPDDSRLNEELVGYWSLDGDAKSSAGDEHAEGKLNYGAKFVESPFGQAIAVDGESGHIVVPRDDSMNVGGGDFTVAAWIRPHELRQGGIVTLGGYGFAPGWVFDTPNADGCIRIETAKAGNQHNGTVQSRSGVLRSGQWQHVAVVVRRGDNNTRLYVNGYEVGVGTIHPESLDNPEMSLHIGRIQNANYFKGDIDEVRYYRRALDEAELEALIEPGREFAQPPPLGQPGQLTLTLGDRLFSGRSGNVPFLAARLPAGPLTVTADCGDSSAFERLVLTRLSNENETAQKFLKFEAREPRVGIHVGLRRDCGSALSPVGRPQRVTSTELRDYVFDGAIANYPNPHVEEDNVNYLAGVREIGIRSEYTDGRDMPRLLLRSAEFEGPYYETWPPATHRNIFIDSDNSNDPPTYAREIIRSFATRAFRRPITDDEESSLFAIWQSSFAATGDFQSSIRDTLLTVLTSPQFLFLLESSNGPEAEPLDSYELASKLSYFLWNAAPDERLLGLADDGTLHQHLDSEIDRLIHDPRFDQFAGEFTAQWLQLDKVDVVEIDRKQFPTLTRDTRTQLRQEPVHFVKYLIRNNLPLHNLVDSDFIVANEVVASYYDLADRTEDGFEFVAIRHDNEHLGGLLTQAGILAGLSDGRESNPVKRGAWLARKIIAEPPDDPPPNVPELEDNTDLTLRERLEKHRNVKGCAKCHSGIDPWGLPFEQFGAGGLFKTGSEGSSILPDETEVSGVNDLKAYLADDRIDQVAFSVLKHLASYAVGRTLTYNEIEFLREKGVELRDNDYRMQDMIRFVVNSELFLEK